MARQALIEKQKKAPKFPVRSYTRCMRCGRPRGCFREFSLCRMCFRHLASLGQLPGIKKASW